MIATQPIGHTHTRQRADLASSLPVRAGTTRGPRVRLAAMAAAVLLAACGGGNGPAGKSGTDTVATASAADPGAARALGASRGAAPTSDASGNDRAGSRFQAARFLNQATYGATDAGISAVLADGYTGWINNQWALPATSHRAYWEAANAAMPAGAGQDQVWESFWRQAVNGDDQLRQRVVLALSEIFVISAINSDVGDQPRALAAWLDMLGSKGLTTYRELLESVALHPLMGIYLSHLHNQKTNPDQNFAREVMQLFSIGLVRLNLDGTPALVGGQPVNTYTPEDVAGLAKVMTGFSYACPAAPNNNCFLYGSSGGVSDPDRYIKPMIGYPPYHSTEAKIFLGVTIPAQTTANPMASLQVALNTLADHPNVGPFIGRQLIQRLVTSNPSPAYVQDVATVFNNNGVGVRGDMKAVIRTILTHSESQVIAPVNGKLREPVLRLGAYMRAYPHTSDTGSFKVGNTDSVASALGQTPLRSPSVFNFFRPGYVAPGTQAAAAGLVSPEMQLVNESSVVGFVNYMRDNIGSGIGQFNGTVGGVVYNRRDLQRDWSAEVALATDPPALVASVASKLLAGQMTRSLNNEIVTAIGKIVIPAANGSNATQIATAKRNRVNAAVLLVVATPEFLTQR